MVNAGVVIANLEELRALTSDEHGAQRVAWSPLWLRARSWFEQKLAGIPVEHHFDAAGNHWITLTGASKRALVLGSHAMYDSFAVIRWSEAGISPATIGLLWSESVTAEVLVFLLIGTTFLRVLKPTGALACAASCGVLRWGVMAQTTDVTALALIQPLHGSPLRCSTSPPAAHHRHWTLRFGRNSAGGLRSCWRWWRHSCSDDPFGMALYASWARRILGDGSAVHCGFACDLDFASRTFSTHTLAAGAVLSRADRFAHDACTPTDDSGSGHRAGFTAAARCPSLCARAPWRRMILDPRLGAHVL